MIAISVLLKATIILAVAGAVHAMFFRRTSAGARHLLWTLVVIAFLLLPVFSLVLPSWTIFVDTTATTPVWPSNKEFSGAPAPLSGVNPGIVPSTSPVKQSIPNAMLKAIDWWRAATLIYAAVFILLAIRFAVDRVRMRRLLGNAKEVTAMEWLSLARDCAAHMGIRRPVRILRDSENTMPMAVGIVHGAVILPADSDTWPEERRRAVLLHEIAHVGRFDCLTQSLAALACTVYWIHPGIWWVARRLRTEREFACDDRVLGSGTNARDYGEHLLELAHGLKAGRLTAAVSMTGSGRLEKRLLALFDTARNRRIPRIGSYVAGIAILVAILVPLALVTISSRTVSGKSLSAFSSRSLLRQTSYSIPAADTPGTWEIRPADRPGAVQVQFQEGNSSHGTTIELSMIVASVVGLPAGFPNVDGPLNFSLPVEAGTFNADGVMRSGVGAGTYTFTPNPQFAETLAKRGYERPSAGEQRLLGEANIGLRFLDTLTAEGYEKPTHLTELLRAASRGVSLNYIRSMANAGYRLGTIDALIDMRASGVTPEFIQELSSAGLPKLSADDLRRVRASGIDAQYVLDLRALGYSKFSLDGLFELRRHGVDPAYIRELAVAGYDGLSLDRLVELRNHGINPEYIRGLKDLGYDKLSLDQLIELRGHGVDPEYAQGLATLGYPKLSLDTLIQLRGHGVDPEYIRSLKDLGYTTVPLDDFVRMRGHGVDADRVRRANARAGKRLSVDELIDMASHGWK